MAVYNISSIKRGDKITYHNIYKLPIRSEFMVYRSDPIMELPEVNPRVARGISLGKAVDVDEFIEREGLAEHVKSDRLEYVARMIKTHMIDEGLPLASYRDWIINYHKDKGIKVVYYNGKLRPLESIDSHDLAFYATDLVNRFFRKD